MFLWDKCKDQDNILIVKERISERQAHKIEENYNLIFQNKFQILKEIM